MKTAAKLDYSVVPQAEAATVRLLVTLTPEPENPAGRIPLDLSLVLDRSGSMHGEKLSCVKEAARELLRALCPEDTVSVTAYNDRVATLAPATNVGDDSESLLAAVDRIESAGTTALCDGYVKAGECAAAVASNSRLSRILLLTDGLANEGITDPDRIAEVVDRFMGQGVGTSTIGVGESYNEELLAKMAERGGGSTYFLRSPREAAEVFAEELRDLSSVDARDIVVRFVPATEGLSVEQLNTYPTDKPLSWRVGDLFGVAPRCLVLEIRVPALEAGQGGEVDLGSVEITFARHVTDGFEQCASSVPVSVRLGTREEVAAMQPDREVTLQAAYLVVARATVAALRLADRREFDEAAALLVACADRLEALGLEDELLGVQLRSVRERARRMREERAEFYRPMERKLMRAESEYGSKGVAAKTTAMHERAARYASSDASRGNGPPVATAAGGARAVYPCYLVGGHILSEIHSDRVLVDTGAVTSISDSDSIELPGGTHRTARSYQGATVTGTGQLVGTRITALLGADVLQRYDARIDLEKGEFELAEGNLPLDSPVIAIDDFQGVPIIAARIGGSDERFFFDTAAKLSYLDSALAAGWTPAGVDTDFFPGFGEFTVETGTKRIELGGHRLDLRFATLPPLLEASLALAGVRGVLGSAVCEGSVVTLSMRRRSVSFG